MASLKVKEICCILYSIALFISGLLLIVFSVLLSYKLLYHFKFVPTNTLGPFIVLFLLGFIHLFLTWLGVKGPTREHNFHIVLFIASSIVLLILEGAVGIWSVIIWDVVDIDSSSLLAESYDELLKSNLHLYKKEWDRLNSKFKCCGLYGVDVFKKDTNVIPVSCCNFELQNSTCPEPFGDGCKEPLVSYVKSTMIDGCVMGFCSCLLQVLGIVAFVFFFKALRAERAKRIQRRLELQRRVSQQENGSANPTPAVPTS